MPSDPKHPATPSECPVCGARLKPGARACPECGADERTGWDEETTRYDGLDLPEESFNRDETLRDEGLKKRYKPKGVSLWWWSVGLALLLFLTWRILNFGF